MKRSIFVTVLVVLCIEASILIPLLLFTPTGANVLVALHPTPTPIPDLILTIQGTPPPIHATATYLLDADTHHVLVNINGQKRLPMASTTKIMTALLAIQQGNLDHIVTIHQDAVDEVKKHDGSSAQLVEGDHIRLRDLLYGLMLPSGDDAAISIADTIGGSPTGFVRSMNTYAHQLHLTHTHYDNPDGLTYQLPDGQPDPYHYTTAADLAQLTRVALQNPLFAQIVQLQRYVLSPTSTHHGYTWETTDNLLSQYSGVTGVKTGYTVEAGYCLVFSATNHTSHHLIGVILHDSDDHTDQRFTDAQTLLDWGFHLPLRQP